MARSDGNAKYAAARRRALARTGDPQTASAARPRDAPEPGLPCICTAADPLRHAGYWHHLTDAGNRTYCTIAAAARCRCETYAPLGERMTGDTRLHYAVKVVDMPPTSITCKCGQVFDGDNPIGQVRDHMEALNAPSDPGPDS